MFAASFVALALAVAGANAQLTMNTPTGGLTECQNIQLTWSGNSGPIQISVYPGGTTTGAIETLPEVDSGNSYTWLCDVASGSSYTFGIHDLTTGAVAYSGEAPVAANPSGNTTCLGQNSLTTTSSSTTSGAASSSSTETSSSTVTSSSTTGESSSTVASSSSTTKATTTTTTTSGHSTSTSTSTSSTGGAGALGVSTALGLLGVVAAFVAL